MKSACLRDYWDLIHNLTQSSVHQEMMCHASSLCLACKTCSVIQRQKGANNLWSNLMLICRWWSKLCQQMKRKLRCGHAGFARWWVLQPEPVGAAGFDHRGTDLTCSVFVLGGKLRQRSEAAWLVATCPGIIPFCSTAGLPFLSLFFFFRTRWLKLMICKDHFHVLKMMISFMLGRQRWHTICRFSVKFQIRSDDFSIFTVRSVTLAKSSFHSCFLWLRMRHLCCLKAVQCLILGY